MKLIRLASLAMATAALLASVSSCKSDPNPFDITITPGAEKNESAYISLNFRVENTRADEPSASDQMATSEEKVIKKVSIYVFNEKRELETSKPNITIEDTENPVVVEVTPGRKTIYAITAESGVNPTLGTTLEAFEEITFESTLAKLKTDAGHMMIGKSDEQQVMVSATQNDIPASNNFSIELTRVLAKAQVKSTGLVGSKFGMKLGEVSFKAKQTCDKMMVVHNGTDITDLTESSSKGTYKDYSLRTTADYLTSVTESFTAEGYEYLPENIISQPKSGNTTFLSIKIATTPEKYYSFAATDVAPHAVAGTPVDGTTYYVVGIVDRAHGISDYTVDSDGHIITFKDQADAQNYASVLNIGEVSPITVSQTESQLRTPSTRADETTSSQFDVFTFENGAAYYRVNIAHTESDGDSSKVINKVVRNKFYKVTINSVNSLGFSEESLLCPTDPSSELDAKGSSWISASFSVAPWEEVPQDVDL